MFDTYLKLPDPIKGESTDDKHKDWIEVMSFSHGIAQHGGGSVSGGGSRVAGKVDVHEFSITKRMDKSSPQLNKFCCLGKHLDKASIELCKSTGKKEIMMKYSFENVMLTSVSVGGGQGQECPVETLSFTFGKVEWSYTPTDHKTGAAGTAVVTNHNLVTNVTG